ncbi:hypothetical protein KCP76_19165 [Salmonella enterica subsp. enterica serovar Weltevreden]|nr:hypothetical protein KCP76_19165 [Salmonella enterica subsp. enterica serovar Weltevreden]
MRTNEIVAVTAVKPVIGLHSSLYGLAAALMAGHPLYAHCCRTITATLRWDTLAVKKYRLRLSRKVVTRGILYECFWRRGAASAGPFTGRICTWFRAAEDITCLDCGTARAVMLMNCWTFTRSGRCRSRSRWAVDPQRSLKCALITRFEFLPMAIKENEDWVPLRWPFRLKIRRRSASYGRLHDMGNVEKKSGLLPLS